MVGAISNFTTIVTIGSTILSVYIAYLTEHHDSSSKQLEIIQATVKQQLDLKSEQLKELEEQINHLKAQNEELKTQYETRIKSLKREVTMLKHKNEELKQKIEKLRGNK